MGKTYKRKKSRFDDDDDFYSKNVRKKDWKREARRKKLDSRWENPAPEKRQKKERFDEYEDLAREYE